MRAWTLGPALILALALSSQAEAGEVDMRRGQFHPDRALPGLDGKLHRLSELGAGKKLIAFHFASW